MPFGLSYAKLAIYGALALAILVLFGLWQMARSDAAKWKATAGEYAAQRDEAIAANVGFKNQVQQLTTDAAKWEAQAKTDHDARIALEQKGADTVVQIQTEVQKVAVPSDDVESPALRAAIDGILRQRAAGANHNAPAGHPAPVD